MVKIFNDYYVPIIIIHSPCSILLLVFYRHLDWRLYKLVNL